jgi:methanogenic corrinoid protein MtbC1
MNDDIEFLSEGKSNILDGLRAILGVVCDQESTDHEFCEQILRAADIVRSLKGMTTSAGNVINRKGKNHAR